MGELAGSIETLIQKLNGRGSSGGTLETVLWFTSGLCGIAAIRLQALESADKRRRKSLDQFLFPLSRLPRLWFDQLASAKVILDSLFEKFQGMKREITLEDVPSWVQALLNIHHLFESSDVELTAEAVNELRSLYLRRIGGRESDLQVLHKVKPYIAVDRLLGFAQTLSRGNFVSSQPVYSQVGDRIVSWMPNALASRFNHKVCARAPAEVVIEDGLYKVGGSCSVAVMPPVMTEGKPSHYPLFPKVYSEEHCSVHGGG